MTWFGWLLGAWMVFKIIATPYFIDRKREPLDAPTACVLALFSFAVLAGVFVVGTGSL